MRRAVAVLGLVVTLAALAGQLALTIEAFSRLGYPLANALIFNFAYFTVLANCFVCACYVAAIWPGASRLARLRRHDVVSFAVPALLLVMLVAAFILRGMLVPPGYFRVAEFALHYLTPPIFLIWWAVFLADGTLKFSAIPPWLFPPAIYLGLVFMRGAVVAVYPYPFFNVAEAGIGRVLTWLAAMLVVFVACCVLTVLADRWLARLKAARTALP